MYKAILFDLDGTLADTVGDIENAVNMLLQKEGYPCKSRAEILAAISYGRREFLRRCLPTEINRNGAEIDRYLLAYNEYYQAHYMVTTLPYEGIPALLQKLREKGILLAVVTNKAHPNACHMIETIFPDGLFHGVWGLDDLPPKPDPANALRAARALNTAPADCLFVGDSEIDVLTAKNAGMTALGVSWGYRSEATLIAAGADAIAHNITELEAMAISGKAVYDL